MRNSILTKKSYWRGPERLKMYYLVVSGLECVQFGCLVSFGSVNLEHGKTWMLVWFHKHSKHRIPTLGRLDIQIPNSMWILTSWWLTNGKIVWLTWKGRNICFMPVDWVLTGLQKKVCEPLQQQSMLSCGGWQKKHERIPSLPLEAIAIPSLPLKNIYFLHCH